MLLLASLYSALICLVVPDLCIWTTHPSLVVVWCIVSLFPSFLVSKWRAPPPFYSQPICTSVKCSIWSSLNNLKSQTIGARDCVLVSCDDGLSFPYVHTESLCMALKQWELTDPVLDGPDFHLKHTSPVLYSTMSMDFYFWLSVSTQYLFQLKTPKWPSWV